MGTINIIGIGSGFGIENWTPATSPIKNDGVWSSSPFISGQQLVMRVKDDAVETFGLICSGANQGEINRHIADFLFSLEAATDFWTSQIALPNPYVYLEYQAECGDYQYAIIKDYRFSVDDDITRRGKGISQAVHCTLVVRRGAWQETPPGEYVNQVISNSEYEQHTAGGVPVVQMMGNTDEEQFIPIANFWTGADWTEIYSWDNSAAAMSGNLLDTNPPYDLWVPPSQVTDWVYFGLTRQGLGIAAADDINVPVPNSLALTMDKTLSSANTLLDPGGGDLFYLDNAGAWIGLGDTVLYISDTYATDADDPRETYVIMWSRPVDIGYRVPGVAGLPANNGFWFRMRPTAAGRRIRSIVHPYTVHRNHLRLSDTQVPGDLPCPLRLQIKMANFYWSRRLLIGLRSDDRQNLNGMTIANKTVQHFTPWIPAIDSTYIYGTGGVGFSYNAGVGVGASVGTNLQTFHQSYSTEGNPGGGFVGLVPDLDNIGGLTYYVRQMFTGKFRLFMIVRQRGGIIGSLGWRVVQYSDPIGTIISWVSKTVVQRIVAEWEILEMGEIVLPSSGDLFETQNDLRGRYINPSNTDMFGARIDFYTDGGGAAVFGDLLGYYLMPVDEGAVELYWPALGSAAGDGGNVMTGTISDAPGICVDSVSVQKPTIKAAVEWDYPVENPEYPNIGLLQRYVLTPVSTNKLQVPAGKSSHLYFFSIYQDETTGAYLFRTEANLLMVKAYRSAQYELTRT